jgi:adenine-specific DNA-methyltransferase
MYSRLKLARNLLRDDGIIFVSIDDNEQANLKRICDEVFGEDNFISNVIWEKKFAPQNDDKYITTSHDYILVYSREKNSLVTNLLPRSEAALKKFKNPDNDPRGVWTSGDLTSKTKAAGHSYPIVSPSGETYLPPNGRQWAPSMETFNRWLAENRIWFGENGDNVPRIKQFLNEIQDGVVPMSIWKYEDVGHNQSATQELKKIFDGASLFD